MNNSLNQKRSTDQLEPAIAPNPKKRRSDEEESASLIVSTSLIAFKKLDDRLIEVNKVQNHHHIRQNIFEQANVKFFKFLDSRSPILIVDSDLTLKINDSVLKLLENLDLLRSSLLYEYE